MATASDTRKPDHATLGLITQPESNVTIRASAGTGKTYLLVSRLLRLLLSGADPAALLAITFTRKAAAEMQQRLEQRLREWLQTDTQTLTNMFAELGFATTAEQIDRGRHQFEQLLRNDRRPRITTFHAFCQDILRRFPVEADVPPGFDLLDDPGILAEQAWDELWHDATRTPASAVARALQSLLENCGGIEACRRALFNFLHHRSDWWAYTDAVTADQAATWASEQLRKALQLPAATDVPPDFYSIERCALLQAYHDLLIQHDTQKNRKSAELLGNILAVCQQSGPPPAVDSLLPIFFTAAGEPASIKESKARARALGEAGQQRFLALHAQLLTDITAAVDEQRRLTTWTLSAAWYLAGQRLLDHFQKLKLQQRLLDFTDLEWRACRLLNDGQHSHWVQYKLDRRISHILVDEFQDTNPTQWRLLLPLLQELAAAPGQDDDREQRSIFLVGDEKQSIYRFRRADPRLFTAAGQWLQQNTAAVEYPLSVSWRSSPAIIAAVNRIFSQEYFARLMPAFPHHDTHRQELSGRVELLPLTPLPPSIDKADETEPDFRNPLYVPRPSADWEQHREEGRKISQHIQSLLNEDPSLGYGDILVLLRQRTHQHDYEQAFRQAGIPYVGSGRKTLLDTLEIQDIVALLQALTSPGDNHALAHTLRSPLFACDDNDLVLLSVGCPGKAQYWYETLITLAGHDDAGRLSPALQRAAQWLPRWHRLARQLPVHDLLDRIFAEGNVEARFQGAFPEHLHRRVRANLGRLLELALKIDSGRYPSLPAFLHKLQRLHQQTAENLLQTAFLDDEVNDAVRIMTIHAAKGLEAAVVYLLDSGYRRPPARAWQTLVDWPSDAARPSTFLLTGRQRLRDDWSQQKLAAESSADAREDANLLYVAVTRAQRFLFISACAHKGEQKGWYQLITDAFDLNESNASQVLTRHSATLRTKARETGNADRIPRQKTAPAEALRQPLALRPSGTSIRPSENDSGVSEDTDSEARDRGVLIHRLLQLCTATPALSPAEAGARIARENHISATDPQFRLCLEEVEKLLSQPDLQAYFTPSPEARVFNEIPLLYNDHGRQIHGVIDRLIVDGNRVTLIDYKTGRHADVSDDDLSAQYRRQMLLYSDGLRRLWPNHRIDALLIFTHSGRQVTIKG